MAAFALAGALVLSGCSSTSIKTTWKSPAAPSGPVKKVAVLAVADQGLVRGGFENRFTKQLAAQGQAAFTTYETLPLTEIKTNKEGAAAILRQAGADSVLILRLVDSSTRVAETRHAGSLYAFMPSDTDTAGWYDFYSVALNDMGVIRDSVRHQVFLETSLFDLTTGKRLWSCATDTILKEDVDRLEVADAFVAKVVGALRKDGLVR
jgi:hypothetical protein